MLLKLPYWGSLCHHLLGIYVNFFTDEKWSLELANHLTTNQTPIMIKVTKRRMAVIRPSFTGVIFPDMPGPMLARNLMNADIWQGFQSRAILKTMWSSSQEKSHTQVCTSWEDFTKGKILLRVDHVRSHTLEKPLSVLVITRHFQRTVASLRIWWSIQKRSYIGS